MAAVAERQTERALLAAAAARQALVLWERTPFPVLDSWDPLRLARVVAGLQLRAARGADPYVAAAAQEQGMQAPAVAALVPAAFAAVNGDGTSLLSLLDLPRIEAREAIGRGADSAEALASARKKLQLMAVTAVQDAGRVADGVADAIRPAIAGYERVVNLPACDRCIVLAGRLYRWSHGFERHPKCDCTMVPVTAEQWHSQRPENTPEQLFARMSPQQQDRAFTKAGAQAIRDGADISQVVNARRGMRKAQVFGHDLRITTEGTTRRGLAGKRLEAAGAQVAKLLGERYRRVVSTPRLMPESIYEIANGDRDEAIRLLKRFGYIH
ncbi:MAG TPA: hypothetical protein VFJ19_09380 [Nocardioidaceae bacterium]|nr:hypothetical protein [Nocardioidaceae bacterium]